MNNKLEFIINPQKDFNPYDYYLVIDGLLYLANYGKYHTINDYLANGYKLISEEEFDCLIKEFNNRFCNNWKEITKKEYEYALDVLPPLKWNNGGFFLSECFTGSIYSFYQAWHGKYYTSYQDINTSRKSILDSLTRFIAENDTFKKNNK